MTYLNSKRKFAKIRHGMGRKRSITDVPGILVGHASDTEALTGCTVILCPDGATATVDVRGGAGGSRQIDSLFFPHLVDSVHAILLVGGSAFGLEAAGGVMSYLEEKGRGFDAGFRKVPIVPTAVIYDLGIGDHRAKPDFSMGYNACLNATKKVEEGSVGAGTGATVGKVFGVEQAMKGGVGTFSRKGPDGLIVGALAVVNAFGDVIDPHTQKIIAGARKSKNSLSFAVSSKWIERGIVPSRFGFASNPRVPGMNTTLSVIATNAKLSRDDLWQVAQMAHSGIAKVIAPAHTKFDGDMLFAISAGNKRAHATTVGMLAQSALVQSVRRAVILADGFDAIPAHRDIARREIRDFKR